MYIKINKIKRENGMGEVIEGVGKIEIRGMWII
jgi:hypothetical protein